VFPSDEFLQASQALEETLDWLGAAGYFAEQGRVMEAAAMLQGCSALHYLVRDVVNDITNDLARVAEGELQFSIWDAVTTYHISVHHAAADISSVLALLMAHYPPPSDGKPSLSVEEAKQLLTASSTLLSRDTSRLRAGLIRERAKLLAQYPPRKSESADKTADQTLTPKPGDEAGGNDEASQEGKPDAEQPPPRLIVDLARKTITFDGEVYEVSSTQALRWVKVLADHPSEWISASELKKHDPDLDGCRTDRLKKHLPDAIRKLIDSQRCKGSRIRL
jgi:hypothetical protein